MKKIISLSIFLAFCVFLVRGYGFSYFEKAMYCQITKGNVVISLQADGGALCKGYVRSLESAMKKVYKDVSMIQQYIDKKEDLGYWKSLKEQKVVLISQLQSMRLLILSHMKTFDTNLFKKSKTYFLDSISTYQKNLNRTLQVLHGLSDAKSVSYSALIQDQLQIIEKIAVSQTFQEMDGYMQRYIYFKQQLAGK